MNMPTAPDFDLSTAMERHRVWSVLPVDARDTLARAWDLRSARGGEALPLDGELHHHLCWLVKGSVGLLDDEDRVRLSLYPGDLFGLQFAARLPVAQTKALTDCTIAVMDESQAVGLVQSHPVLAGFIALPGEPPPTVGRQGAGDSAINLMTTSVQSLVKRPPISLPPDTSIRRAAEVMRDQRVSSVVILQDEHLFGLITDRDLRNRVLAAGLDSDRPIMDIATLAPMSIQVQRPAFEALMLMARHNIHHVPVVDGQRVVGMVTATDVTEQHSTSAVYLASDIHQQGSIEGLQASTAKVKRLQQSLAAAESSAYSSGHIITAITDAVTSRLIQLAELQFGPAPVDYVWVAAGSQARSEQTAKTDQDNCLVLSDDYDEAAHGEYFDKLARFVCDGLNACGYVHCPGEMMAMTPQWRQPRQRWAEYFTRWTSQPDPTALMLTCVFFDLRAVHGNTAMLDQLRAEVLSRTQGNTIFLAHMVGNALTHQPPLGMFKGISTIRSGEHKGTIDLKLTGVVPIVDLARVYALAGGHAEVNTHDRLTAASAGGALSEQSARDLRDALEFLAFTRIQHQTRQMAAGQAPDNFLNPDEVSNFERSQLKDAFHVVQSLQTVLEHRYQSGRF
jgi:CBS domain-containing protein